MNQKNEKRLLRVNGGEAIARMLSLHDAQFMFGMGGFQLLPFYDAIYRAGDRTPKHININDERCGAFAADGYARVSGRPGLCDGTLGPGATNLVTGLVEALTAGIPVIALVGESNRDHCSKNMTQETPHQAELLSMISKEFIRVERGHRIPELVRRAYVSAISGRPGPVVLSVPEDIAHGEWQIEEHNFYPDQGSISIPGKRIRPDPVLLKKAADLISHSKRPVLLVGGGIHLSQAYDELLALVEELHIPVAHTLSGKGAVPCRHSLCINLFGRFNRIANEVIKDADLLIALGFKFGEIATSRYQLIPDDIKIIHIDISAEEIGKHQRVALGIWSDCKMALIDLLEELREDAGAQKLKRNEYVSEIQMKKEQWRKKMMGVMRSAETPIHMGRLCDELSRVMPDNGILVADGGFAAHWTGLLYDAPSAGRTYVANRGNASIGYGLPGGIGAQLAAGKTPVIAVTGDVGFNMTMGELETAIRESVPLTIVIVNNAASGYVKALQHKMFGGRYQSSDLHELNYANIAQEMGGHGIRVQTPEYLEGALKEGLSERSIPTVIDVTVTRDPSQMLPAADARTGAKAKGVDRIM